ncbi:MAG: histidine kinase [Actinomycetota bacterium]
MKARTARHTAWGLLAVGAALAGTGMVLSALNRSDVVQNALFSVIFLSMALTGSLIASRQPGNAIGWLLLWTTLAIGAGFVSDEYSTYTLVTNPGALPGGVWAAWVTSWSWTVGIIPMVTFLFLLFPDGQLPSHRWRPVAWAAATALAVLTILGMLNPEMDTSVPVRNPIGIESAGDLINQLIGIPFLILAGLGLLSAWSLFLRFRRSRGEEREQMKWFALAAGLLVGWLVVATIGQVAGIEVLYDSGLNTAISAVSFLAVPLAVGVAILKYRLYEIDIVIRKTVVVGVLAAFITAVYVAVVVGVGAVAAGRASNRILPIVAAVVVAVAFQPVRARARRLANRLVLGPRATPYEVLSAFSERVSGMYATENLLPRMARILGEGTGAQRAEVWLRVGSKLRPAASWPPAEDGTASDPLPLLDGELPSLGEGVHALPVRQDGELLGAIGVTKPPSEPLSPEEEKLLAHLAAQAGLVLRNVRLTEELRARLEELQASSQRIVSAQDEERRRLERNLHDGAQQHLVALAVKQRLAETVVRKDPEKAASMLAELQQDTAEALENLRDLARGIYPPLLADKGLAAALQAQVRKVPLPVTVEADGIRRYPQEAESAVYFCCLEALQNVAKYAAASRAVVRIRQEEGELAFSVEDDGRGYDSATTPLGSGLQNMADRLSALGGTLDVRSRPDEGTTVTGRIPARAAEPVA